MSNCVDFNILEGKIITRIIGGNLKDEEIVFICDDHSYFILHHVSDFNEEVYMASIVGVIKDILGKKIIKAKEIIYDEHDTVAINEAMVSMDDSFTWSMYDLVTENNKKLTLRWYGTSSGFLVETPWFEQISIEEVEELGITA